MSWAVCLEFGAGHFRFQQYSIPFRRIQEAWQTDIILFRVHSYLPSDPHLADPTSIYTVKLVDQQDQSKYQHFQPHS